MRTTFASGVRQGAPGPPGASASAHEYVFGAASSAPPGSGQIRTDGATAETASLLWVSYMAAAGAIAPLLRHITAGAQLVIQDKGNPGQYASYVATADAIDNPAGGYVEVPVTFVDKAGSAAKANQRILLFHSMAGAKGDPGPPGDPAPPVSPLLLHSPYACWRPGAYYDQRVAGSGAASTGGATAARLTLAPMVIPWDLRFDRIAIYVSTASATAGTFSRLGLYASDTMGKPSALVLDAGTVPNDSTGLKELPISLSLTAGLYWPAVWNKETGSFSCACIPAAGQGLSSGTTSPSNSSTLPNGYLLTQSGLTALPASATGLTDGPIVSPAIWLRVAP
jgi:hypothetical protein